MVIFTAAGGNKKENSTGIYFFKGGMVDAAREDDL